MIFLLHFLKLGDAESPPHFYKYFTRKNCAADFFHSRTHFGSSSTASTIGAKHIPIIGLAAGNSIIHTVTTSILILILISSATKRECKRNAL